MHLNRLFIFLLFILMSSSAVAQGYLKAAGKKIINDKGEIILKGMGLGGWMLQEPYMLKLGGVTMAQHDIQKKITGLIGESNTKKFYEAWLANHCTKADIDSLAAWGFNSVRLPMHYNLFTLPVEAEKIAGKNTWLSKGFTLTDSLLSWCKANRIYLVLDLHAAPGGQGNDNAISDRDTSKPSLWQSDANKKKTIALWEQLATRYANEEWIGGYDLVNEPNWGFQNESDKNGCSETENVPLKELFTEITKAIRKVDKNHLIIIEGNCWGNNYKGMFPLWDDNMALSFHKYWNYTNKESIQIFLDYREKYNVPVWLGETGENSNTWFTSTIKLMEENNIGWNMWPWKKSGLNNPLQVKINKGYQDIIDYWNGQAPKPSQKDAFKSLMEFAENTRAQNNIPQFGVRDAMIRQVNNETAIPFTQNIIRPNAIIFAADYDIGRSGIAYHDIDSANYWVSTTHSTQWNEGSGYRNDGVDIEHCTDTVSNGYNVGWINDGEWLQYTVYAERDQEYNVNVRFSSAKDAGLLQLLINDSDPVKSSPLPVTGDFKKWMTVTLKSLKLNKGSNRLRLLAVKGGFNLNYLKFIATNNTAKID